ncbi:LytR/AlgR family response regulator transcription factor [Spongiivirga citrea]|uniref:Response regulator n=1 Tax=Spongiivirga citrea TaxID=1481457 RepID=A0A6M0CMW0_9FLAO|nr:LytTR family DNA-binding domain-containing protein [Spongiivirga citrea]NER18992.1 response regulator [Spongiivirga citrea]
MLKNALSAIIVEDDPKGAKLLAHIINTYCDTINLTGIAFNLADAKKLINQNPPRVLFLDVQIGNQTCFSLLEEIAYENIKIVIVSAYDNFAIEAFKYHAVDYILKPVDIDEMIKTTQRIYQNYSKEIYSLQDQKKSLDSIIVNKNNSNFIAIASLNDIQIIKYDSILYLQSDGRYTSVFLIDGSKIVATKNIGEYENDLTPFGFYRIHKKYIINLKHMASIDKRDGGRCKLINECYFPIATRRRDGLFRYLNLKK